jgi:hypothetical protein
VFLSALHMFKTHWLIPALPFFALCAACALDAGLHGASALRRPALARTALAGIALEALAVLCRTDIVHGRELAGTDTRTSAATWIAAHLPKQSRLLMEIDGPQLPRNAYEYYIVTPSGKAIANASESDRRYAYYRPDADWHSDVIGELRDLSALRAKGIDYVITSRSDAYAAAAAQYPHVTATYASLPKFGDRVFSISPQPGESTGPSIAIYRITKSEERVSDAGQKRHVEIYRLAEHVDVPRMHHQRFSRSEIVANDFSARLHPCRARTAQALHDKSVAAENAAAERARNPVRHAVATYTLGPSGARDALQAVSCEEQVGYRPEKPWHERSRCVVNGGIGLRHERDEW